MRAAAVVGLLALAAPAVAQPAPPAKGAPAQPPAADAAPAPAPPAVAAPAPAPPPARDPLHEALAAQPGGLTPDEVAKTALKTRRSIRVKQAELRAAAAKVDQAFIGYFPRLTGSASYTHVSEPETFSLGGGGPQLFVQNPGALRTAACPPPAPAGQTCVVDSADVPVAAINVPAFNFPQAPLDQFSLVASLAVPVSDYVLRASQSYAAASHALSAKQLTLQAELLQTSADARIGFFNWVRAQGQVVVAREALEQAKAHAEDGRRIFQVGYASKADVLGLEARVAQAEQAVAESEAFAAIADEQLRIVLQAPPRKELRIGIDVLKDSPHVPPESLAALQDEALKNRLEIRALDETIYSLKKVESVARAGYFPRLDATANLIYARPNPREPFFPDEWRLTWDVGLRLTWTINDTFAAIPAVNEAKANTEAVEEQKAQLLEGLRVEVASAYAEVKKAAASIEAAERGLAAAEEALRVRHELFRNGKATSVDLIDAEAAVTGARLQRINAHVGLLVAITRLEHATGRDARGARATGASR